MKESKWQQVRALYPALSDSVYLTTAAVAPLSKRVYEANLTHLNMMYNTGDIHWEASVERMNELRQKMAEFLNCQAQDLAFGNNTSLNMNFIAMIIKSKLGACEVVTLDEEFPSTVLPWMHHGFEVNKLKLKDFKNAEQEILNNCTDSTKVVVVSHQQFSSGLKLDLLKLGGMLKEKSILFVVNATQSLGIFPVDCQAAHISALTASCHKWVGIGYGLSLLFIKKGLWQGCEWPVYGWLSQDEENFMSHQKLRAKEALSVLETGVPNFQLIYSLDAQIDFLNEFSKYEIAERVLFLSRTLKDEIKKHGFKILSFDDSDNSVVHSKNSGTVLVEVDDPENWLKMLADRKVFVSVRQGGLRLAISYYNDEDDIKKLVQALVDIQAAASPT